MVVFKYLSIMKSSVLFLGRAHFFYGDYKNRPSLKKYMELAGVSYFLRNFTVFLL